MTLTDAQRALLEDKFVLWERASREGPTDLRDYNRRCAEALKAALCIVSEAATRAADEPWRRYDGKGRPVPNGTPIEIQQRNGQIRRGDWFSDATWRVGGSFPSEDVAFWRPASSAEKRVPQP